MDNKHFEMEKTCEYCGNTFTARKENTRFCSQRCQKRAMAIKKQNEMEDQDYEQTDFESRGQSEVDCSGNADYYGVLGGLFGVQAHGSQQEQMLTSLLAVQKNQIESNQSISLLKMQMDSMSKELDSLRQENQKLRSSEDRLRSENDSLSRQLEDVMSENEKLSEEVEKSGDKMNQIGNVAGMVFTQALMGILPQTKIGKLMGLGGADENTASLQQESNEREPSTAPRVRPSVSPVDEPFEVEAVGD